MNVTILLRLLSAHLLADFFLQSDKLCKAKNPNAWTMGDTRIRRIERIGLRILGVRQKHEKPLAIDAWCLLRSIDAVPVWKSLKQAWIFSGSRIITHSGLCFYRKAINIDKPLVLWRTALNIVGFAFVFSPRHSLSKLSSALICTRFQAEYHVLVYPGTPPSSVYQVTHGTALQAAELCEASCDDTVL